MRLNRWQSACLAAAVGLCVSHAARAEEKGKEENEQKLSIKEVPDAVRATLKRESFGAKIKTVDLEKRDGKTVYEADAVIDGENYEILVSKGGKLISKTLDAEEGEKSEAKKASAKEDDDEKPAKAKSKAKHGEDDDDKPAKAKADDDDEKPAKAKAKAKHEDDDDEKPVKKKASKEDKEEKEEKEEKD